MHNVIPLIKREFSLNQPNANLYPYLPKDMLVLILSYLPKLVDLCNFNQTCRNLYPLRNEDGLWNILFKRCFPHLANVVPRQSWFDLCQAEHLGIRNVIQEKYATQRFSIEGEGNITCLTLTGDGRVVFGKEDGSIRILDPMTGETVLLADCSEDKRVFGLECKGDFLLSDYANKFRIWDLTKKQEIAISYGEKGFPEKELYGSSLSNEGQLFVSSGSSGDDNNQYALWIWDLKQPEVAPQAIMLDKCALAPHICGRTVLFDNAQDAEISFFNLDTNKHQIFINYTDSLIQHASNSIALGFMDETTFCSRGREGNKNKGPIFVWDLKCEATKGQAPSPSKVIAEDEEAHLFRVTWDSAIKSETTWPENLLRPLKNDPVCSFPELSLLFQRYAFLTDDTEGPWKDPALTMMSCGPNYNIFSRCSAYQNGKFFYCSDAKSISCVKFAASDREILADIAEALKSENPSRANYAKNRLTGMPQPIRDAIHNSVEIAIHEISGRHAQQSRQQIEAQETDLNAHYAGPILAYKIDLNALYAVAICQYLEETKEQ
jgi:hypothetical protein